MIELTDWIRSAQFPNKPWLVLGKGPTFSQRKDYDLTAYNLLGLNHVVAEMSVDIAHAVDVEVVEACAANILTNCGWLIMPRVPHVQNRPSYMSLEDFIAVIPALRSIDTAGRLVWYNAATSRPTGRSPVIGVRYFSSEAALNILAEMGAKQVRSLGIDGGRDYSQSFAHLKSATLLSNSQPSFDLQFPELQAIARRSGMDYQPLVEPIRVFVGLARAELAAAAVLEHSIKSNTNRTVQFTTLTDVGIPRPRSRRNRPRTTFSFCRFTIPKLCGYAGRAIYLDSDMQVFGDIQELWDAPFGDNVVLCTTQPDPPPRWKGNPRFHPGPQMSVMVLDCSRLTWDIEEIVRGLDEGQFTYEDLMFNLCVVDADRIDAGLPVEWNHLERFEPGITKLVHYTQVGTQPWKSDANPLLDLWMHGFRSAVSAGAIDPETVRQLGQEGLVKKSLAPEAFAAAPSKATPPTSSLALELAAARARVDDLEAGPFKLWWHRLKRLYRDAAYLARLARRGQAIGRSHVAGAWAQRGRLFGERDSRR